MGQATVCQRKVVEVGRRAGRELARRPVVDAPEMRNGEVKQHETGRAIAQRDLRGTQDALVVLKVHSRPIGLERLQTRKFDHPTLRHGVAATHRVEERREHVTEDACLRGHTVLDGDVVAPEASIEHARQDAAIGHIPACDRGAVAALQRVRKDSIARIEGLPRPTPGIVGRQRAICRRTHDVDRPPGQKRGQDDIGEDPRGSCLGEYIAFCGKFVEGG